MTSNDVSYSSSSSSCGAKPIDYVTVAGEREELGSSGSCGTCGAKAEAAGSCERSSCGTSRRGISRRTLALRSNANRWRKHWADSNRALLKRKMAASSSSSRSGSSASSGANSPGVGTASQSNNPGHLASSDSSGNRLRGASTPCSKDILTPGTNVSADADTDTDSSLLENQNEPPAAAEDEAAKGEAVSAPRTSGSSSEDGPFANLDAGSPMQSKTDAEMAAPKAELANVIEKAILDFCSSRTVETMRRMFAGVTSEMEALQGEARQGGDKSVQAPHPVTAELVKEGIVIGQMDVFAPRVHREYRLLMRDSLVEGFLKDAGVFRSICYRTKCQLEVTRRLLNRKLCTGGRWVKYLIVRIVGPSLRAITCCDQLLQKAVPAFKQRIEYPKAAYCRLFFREEIPDNTLLYSCFQRTGGTSNRYGALRLETPYRLTTDRTVGNCPWKSGALKVGKLSFSGSGGHLSMQQVYPGYGYTFTAPVEPASKGVEAVHRIEQMHSQFLTNRQQLLQERRVMTIPVCR